MAHVTLTHPTAVRVRLSRAMLLGVMLAATASCAYKQPDLKSPCVGAENSPCDRRPVNDWWAKA